MKNSSQMCLQISEHKLICKVWDVPVMNTVVALKADRADNMPALGAATFLVQGGTTDSSLSDEA